MPHTRILPHEVAHKHESDQAQSRVTQVALHDDQYPHASQIVGETRVTPFQVLAGVALTASIIAIFLVTVLANHHG